MTLLTCFSRSAFSQKATCGDTDVTTALRKQEDVRYASSLGPVCRPAWLDLPDAPLRGHALRNVCEAREMTPEEHSLARRLRDRLLSDWIPRGAAVFAPLAIGGHIDHRILHEAAAAIAVSGFFQVVFYEDMPYSSACEEREIVARIIALQRRLNSTFLPSRCQTRSLLAIKKSAASCYPSQVRPEILQKVFDANPPLDSYMHERVWQFWPQKPVEEIA